MKFFFAVCVFVGLMSCSSTTTNQNANEASASVTEEVETVAPSGDLASAGHSVTEKVSDIPSEPENPNIKVTVDGISEAPIFMIGTFTDQRFRADSTYANKNGTFVIKKNEPFDAGLYYLVFPDNSYIQILLDKDQTFTMKTSKANLINDMVVQGDLENQVLYENLKFQDELKKRTNRAKRKKKELDKDSPEFAEILKEEKQITADRKAHLDALFSKYPNTFFTAFKKAGQNPELKRILGPDGKVDKVAQVSEYRKDFWDDVDFTDERLIHTPVINNKLKRYIEDLTAQNPDSLRISIDQLMSKLDPTIQEDPYYSFFVNWIGLKYEPGKAKLMDAEAIYVHMVENYYTYDRSFWADSAQIYALQLRAHEMSASLIGKKGPDVRAKDPSGQFRSIYEMDEDYIIVYMYNPQCEHCAKETPKLVNFHRNNKDKGFGVFAIAIDTNEQEWKDYVKKNGMQGFSNVFDPTNKAIYATYFVNVTPELYVLNPDRTLIGKNLKVSQIKTVVERDKEKRTAG